MINLKLSAEIWRYLATMLCIASVSGCASLAGNPTVGSGDQLLQEAQEALRSGAKSRAQKLFEDASKTNPADKKPWVNLAQMHFDEGNYAQAITAGQEVLARDSKDQVARSIVLVSSLRVAAKSLAEMRELNQWTGDARAEAKKVASILRENLGEEVLVPDINANNDEDERKAVKIKPKPKPKPRPKNTASPQPTENEMTHASPPPAAVAPPPKASGGGRSDPFGSLR